jgi:putative two-component system response regulator
VIINVSSAFRRQRLEVENRIYRENLEQTVADRTAKLQEVLDGTIQVIAQIVESRDPYTAGHQQRVAEIAVAIAEKMGFSQDRVKGIRMAGVIHDLGKISVPAEILSKPSRLNDMEFGLIKAHPQTGYDILKGIEFPWPIAEMVYQHHERIDGSGYPRGLKSKEILPEALILSVADVVEAMASHRPYRAKLGIDKALAEISKNRGVLYDPEAADACLKLFGEKQFNLE